MSPDPTSVPDPTAVDARAEEGARHRILLQQANAALAASPAPALLDCVQTIQRIVLAADPSALRRSVSWLDRLLARDITLQAEAEALRSQLGVHVLQARQQLQALAESDQQLQALGLELHAAIDQLGQQSTQLAGQPVTDDSARRLHYLATLSGSCNTTASHLDLTVIHHRQLSQHVQQMLPQVELLLDQQRMLREGLTAHAALQSATNSMEALQHLQSTSLPDVTPSPSSPDDTTPR